MILKHILCCVAAVAAFGTAAPGVAQKPTPTTRILAIGTIPAGTDMQRVRTLLPSEMRATAELYLQGRIDQWYSLEDRNGVAFILNVTDPAAAKAMLEGLPLGQAHLLTFELLPLGPLDPLRQLLPAPGAR